MDSAVHWELRPGFDFSRRPHILQVIISPRNGLLGSPLFLECTPRNFMIFSPQFHMRATRAIRIHFLTEMILCHTTYKD